MRRIKDLLRAYAVDLGGEDRLSEGQRAIVRRCVMLQTQLELLEAKFAENDGAASRVDLETYQRCSNSLRRLLESLNLHRGRIAKDVTDHGTSDDAEVKQLLALFEPDETEPDEAKAQ
jgi:hypothetical protein